MLWEFALIRKACIGENTGFSPAFEKMAAIMSLKSLLLTDLILQRFQTHYGSHNESEIFVTDRSHFTNLMLEPSDC